MNSQRTHKNNIKLKLVALSAASVIPKSHDAPRLSTNFTSPDEIVESGINRGGKVFVDMKGTKAANKMPQDSSMVKKTARIHPNDQEKLNPKPNNDCDTDNTNLRSNNKY
eukprot:GABV01007918.1.p1 GENE.GABV01007918.1~~GABV01007918.1.p1  ORF type:complete len:110 (-),score=30.68 GABV01007918.1:11-340(-)